MQIRLLGSGDKPACRWPVASPPPPPPNAIVSAIASQLGAGLPPAGRRSLLQSAQAALRRWLAGSQPEQPLLEGGWRQLLAVEVTEDGVDTLVLQAYERLALIALVLLIALAIHQLLAWYWHWVSQAKHVI